MTCREKQWVLDHGYVRFVESWGRGDAGEPEAGIIEAARQSTQGSFRGWERDEKLLGFLFNSEPPHSTPFEFAGMVIEVQAPILVFREWHRHRTQSYNEMSARYSPLPDLNYIPTIERCLITDKSNKQAQGLPGTELTANTASEWLREVNLAYEMAESVYQNGLKAGIPKEVARIVVPVGRYSRMRASTCLRNWLSFMTLRHHPKAQWEIQQFAGAVGIELETEFPRVMKLFNGKDQEFLHHGKTDDCPSPNPNGSCPGHKV
jgi:thymidylate synthase (FAD)